MSDKKTIEEFNGEVEQADWSMLKDHHKRGALFEVSLNLNLAEVANAFAKDYSSIVKLWLDDGDLVKVDDDRATKFAQDEFKKIANFLIVQPYVLIQMIECQ
ncbi:MAG: DUF2288 domain-containing protein [Bacteriovoracaceae bacterium]|jgi:hypothetical protein|nr:DUF2288 domain-containing protein [Bacteriovoracaceae bacterium]